MRPDEAVLAPPQPAALGQPLGLQQALLAEVPLVGRRERPLVGGGLQVRPADVRVVQVDDRLLDAAPQEAVRLAHEVLVERVLAGHQHGVAVPGPAGPAPALPQARDRAGEAGDERDVEAADVDAELERLRRDHGVELVVEQAPLDVAALLGRVAGAVGLDPARLAAPAAVLEAAADVPVHELRRLARRRERDHPRARQHALGGDVARLGERALAHAGRRVLERRVPEHHRPLRPRRLVLVHHLERRADQALGELLRVADGRRGEHEARVGAVLRAEPAQAPHHLGDVAAEHAPVHVRLVEHHVAELVQELRPALVGGEDADVQHVGVGEQDGRGAPQQRALVLRRVAVVDRRDDARAHEACELARLVLRERLGGEEEERPRLRLLGEGLEHGELVAEALAARRAGADDDVVAGRQQVAGGGLVAVQGGDAGRGERFAQRGRQLLGEAGGAAAPRRLVRHADHLLVPAAREERAQGAGGGGRHAGVVVHGSILLRPRRRRPACRRGRLPAASASAWCSLLNDEGALARPFARPLGCLRC